MLGYDKVLEKKIRGNPVLGDAITCLITVDYIPPYKYGVCKNID